MLVLAVSASFTRAITRIMSFGSESQLRALFGLKFSIKLLNLAQNATVYCRVTCSLMLPAKHQKCYGFGYKFVT